MLFWKICWNLVGIRGWVISTGRTWATSSTQGQCVSVFVDWLRLGGRPVSNISELSWILFLNVGRYILCHEVSEIKGCVQASNLLTFKISGMCYIILFKHGTKFSSFTHLMLPPHLQTPAPRQQIWNLTHYFHPKSLLKTFPSSYCHHCHCLFMPSLSWNLTLLTVLHPHPMSPKDQAANCEGLNQSAPQKVLSCFITCQQYCTLSALSNSTCL